MDGGTLFQLRNLLMRRGVTNRIKSDPTACEEFFTLVVEAHILTIVMKKFGMEKFDDSPTTGPFDETFFRKSPQARMDTFEASMSEVVKEFTNVLALDNEAIEKDYILAYSKELLTLGMFFFEFVDSIREGDGNRILRCWKYLLLIFKATNKRKYAVQACTLLFQYHYLFSERLKMQLVWSRTINVSGRPGRNIPMDLEMEHLNRELKEAISCLNSNINENSISRIGKCLKKLVIVKNSYDECSDIKPQSTYHSSRSLTKDIICVVEELKKCDVYSEKIKRKHSQFPKFRGNIAGGLKSKDVETWLTNHFKKLLNI